MPSAARLPRAVVAILSLIIPASAYTWPDRTDFLESLYYQQVGYNGLLFGAVVKSCGFSDNLAGTGRTNTAEWIRTAYHDMATADLEAGTGGLDASLSFELDRQENVGKASSTPSATSCRR